MPTPRESQVDTSTEVQFGIGALSEATGVPAPTLRTWERRYGFPSAERTPGGQRVYHPDVVERVRLAARAMALGHRPAAVLHAPIEALRSLVGDTLVTPSRGNSGGETGASGAQLGGPEFETELRGALARVGLWEFLRSHVVPLLNDIGTACASGRMSIFEEHALSERIREFLAATWRPMADTNTGPIGLCATLPGEQHGLGLHLVSSILALEGWRVEFFGVDLPIEQIATGAAASEATAVFVSVSAVGKPKAVKLIPALRDLLPDHVELIVGGGGAMDRGRGITVLGLEGLREWLRNHPS